MAGQAYAIAVNIIVAAAWFRHRDANWLPQTQRASRRVVTTFTAANLLQA